MKLFSNKPSKKDKANLQNEPASEEIARRWENAYRANPSVYEKEGEEGLLIGFALTEDCDSIFPLVPEEQWAIEGKTIGRWIITMVSLTNPQGGIIGQMEYHEAMKRLEPFFLAGSGNWVMIRAMTYGEMDGLFEGLPRRLV